MWKDLGPSKKNYIDQNKKRAKKEIIDALPNIIEYGTEDDLIKLVKTWNPKITPAELRDFINVFRAAKSERVK